MQPDNVSPSTLAPRKETRKMIQICCHLGWGQISHSQPHCSVSGQVSHLQFWGTSRCPGFLDDYLPQLGQLLQASSTPISILQDGKSSGLFQLEGLHESPLLCRFPHSCILLSPTCFLSSPKWKVFSFNFFTSWAVVFEFSFPFYFG